MRYFQNENPMEPDYDNTGGNIDRKDRDYISEIDNCSDSSDNEIELETLTEDTWTMKVLR